MAPGTHTHWRMTINNYDETDLALVQQGYPDHIRQLVYTLEEGEEGTPHIQAFIKMKRDCRLSHMKKLFPRGNFGAMDSSEWKLNQQRYAQKLDETATSPAVITNWDPLLSIEGVLKDVCRKMYDEFQTRQYKKVGHPTNTEFFWVRDSVQREMVGQNDYKYAKVFVSATYKAMWKEYGRLIYHNLEPTFRRAEEESHVEIPVSTHTHTHTDENISVSEDITNAEAEDDLQGTSEGDGPEGDGEDYEECTTSSDEGYSEGSGSESDEEDDG